MNFGGRNTLPLCAHKSSNNALTWGSRAARTEGDTEIKPDWLETREGSGFYKENVYIPEMRKVN